MIKLSFIFTLMAILTLLTSCSTTDDKKSQEISLKADRKLLDKYRTETPEDIKAENDFMALVLKDMAEVKSKPQDVRDRFYKEVRRKRDAFNMQYRKIREKFNADDKKKREAFLTKTKKERDHFVASKPKSDESREFFQDQNTNRTAFFQDQYDARKEFESQMDAGRKDFNEDMDLKQKQFEDAYREYSKNYTEKEKQKKLEKAAAPVVYQAPAAQPQAMPAASYPGQDKDLQEFDNLKDTKRESLGD
jgi:hypothetical protein